MARQGPRPRAENPAPPLPPSSHSVDLAQPIHPTYDTRPVMSASPGIDSTATATLLARGICRALDQLGYASLVEFPLINGRRADRKWARYRDFADRLYFAVPNHFPQLLIPEECGLMVADPFGAALLRDGHTTPLNPSRRRALTLRFARIAAARLYRCLDPEAARLHGM